MDISHSLAMSVCLKRSVAREMNTRTLSWIIAASSSFFFICEQLTEPSREQSYKKSLRNIYKSVPWITLLRAAAASAPFITLAIYPLLKVGEVSESQLDMAARWGGDL